MKEWEEENLCVCTLREERKRKKEEKEQSIQHLFIVYVAASTFESFRVLSLSLAVINLKPFNMQIFLGYLFLFDSSLVMRTYFFYFRYAYIEKCEKEIKDGVR